MMRERGRPSCSLDTDSAVLRIRYDDDLGRFHQRTGGGCSPVLDNPDKVVITLEASQPIDGCTFWGSWDSAPIPCVGAQIDAIKRGLTFTLNTDGYRLGPPPDCQEEGAHLPPGTTGWFEVTYLSGELAVTKRINLRKL